MSELDNERMVMEAENRSLTVTSHRIRQVSRGGGKVNLVSIMLEAVTSCELTYTTYPALLVLSGICILAGLVTYKSADLATLAIWLLVAGIFAVLYLIFRRQVLRVASPTAHIDVLLSSISHDAATGVIDTIERAKDRRYAARGAQASGG